MRTLLTILVALIAACSTPDPAPPPKAVVYVGEGITPDEMDLIQSALLYYEDAWGTPGFFEVYEGLPEDEDRAAVSIVITFEDEMLEYDWDPGVLFVGYGGWNYGVEYHHGYVTISRDGGANETTMIHELGHAMGLGHVSHEGNYMHATGEGGVLEQEQLIHARFMLTSPDFRREMLR